MQRPTAAAEPPKTRDWAEDESAEHRQKFARAPSSPSHRLASTSSASTGGSHETGSSSATGLRKTRSALGLHPDAPIDSDDDVEERQKLLWSRIRVVLREPFLEFFGVMVRGF